MWSQQSLRHHYIPIWYQKGFLAPGQTSFRILDMRPEVFRDASGKVRGVGRTILNKGPDAHFWEPDLYTIRWLGRTDVHPYPRRVRALTRPFEGAQAANQLKVLRPKQPDGAL